MALHRFLTRCKIVPVTCLLLAPMTGAAFADDLRIAIVAPVAGSTFFDAVQSGCDARARQRADKITITCLYGGPGFALAAPEQPSGDAGTAATPDAQPTDVHVKTDSRSQAQIILDFAAARVDGIAVSPSGDPAVASAITTAVKAGIPVITFDADAPESGRAAFVGTNARDFGRALGASLKRWKPKGGKYAIVSTDPAQPAIAERIFGVRDVLGPEWSEITESPAVTTGAYKDAIDRIDHLLSSYYDVDAIISVGAWPMLDTDNWRELMARFKERVDKADVVLVVADALPEQKDLVRQGLGHVLVGQRPTDMGARIADLLVALKSGKKSPEVVYTGFETFTRLDLVGQ